MLTVKMEHKLSTAKKRIFSILSCHEVRPLVGDSGDIYGLACDVFGADNASGESFERTIALKGDFAPSHVYVENCHGNTVQSYSYLE